MRPLRVYVAGPYSGTSIEAIQANIRAGMDICERILAAGHAVYCPWLDFAFGLRGAVSVAALQRNSMAWLEVSDCVVLAHGWMESAGTRREIERAWELNKCVFNGPDEFLRSNRWPA